MADGIRIPIALSGAAVLGVVFGGGALYNKIDNQQQTISELKVQIQNDEDGQTLAGLAECRANIVALEKTDARHDESIRNLWRVKQSKPNVEAER